MTDQYLLRLATDLAERAAAAILAIRSKGFDVVSKSDESPVTAADHAAEALIVAGLRQATPAIPVIAEEEVAAGRVTAPSGEYWLVDPLDGTREFAAGRDEFTVNVGLVRDGRAVIGAVAVPALGELFGGIVGHGAFKRGPAGEHPIHTRTAPDDGLTVMCSRHYAADPKLAAFLEGRPVASVTNIGSAVKFLRVAEGAADLYPRLGRTMEWDTAAPQAVLEAAGGHVRLFDGTSLAYGKPDWANPPFICTGK
jgi:3'(2'), 5'-bisphosphate nucleotidase